MINNRPDNWRELRDDYTKTFITAEKFEKLISKDGFFFYTEKCRLPHETCYIRVSKAYEGDSIDRWSRMRTHNIIVDSKDKSINYEGVDSMWHEVYGPEGSYEKLLDILNSKVREV